MCKPSNISDAIASILSYKKIKELIVDFSILSKIARVDKHIVGLTIRRRDYDKEFAYGECKHALNLLYNARNAKEFVCGVEFSSDILYKARKEIGNMNHIIESNIYKINKEKYNRIKGAKI